MDGGACRAHVRYPGLCFCFPFLPVFQQSSGVSDPKYRGHLDIAQPAWGVASVTVTNSPGPVGSLSLSLHHRQPVNTGTSLFAQKETEAQRSSVTEATQLSAAELQRSASFPGSLQFPWVCSVPGRQFCRGRGGGERVVRGRAPWGSRWVLRALISPAASVSPWLPPASWSPQAPALSSLLLTLRSLLALECICLRLISLPRPEGFLPPGTCFSIPGVLLIPRNPPDPPL